MFILTKKETYKQSLQKMADQLEGIQVGPLIGVKVGDYQLGWMKCKHFENFHAFEDGFLIGKIRFDEKPQDDIIQHTGKMPSEFHPLLEGTLIRVNGKTIVCEPLNTTNIYYYQDSVSDMQLLIADLERLKPSPEGVAVLATVGYFPGNLTLFNEIKKIPFLLKYDVSQKKTIGNTKIEIHKPDDNRLIERLVEIVPEHPRQYLGISAGYDSRFVLGILLRGKINLELIHLLSIEETDLVKQIASVLNLPLHIVEDKAKPFNTYAYSLATDAQIYLGGGGYSCTHEYIDPSSLYHNGFYANAVLKNAFKTAMKIPGKIESIYHKLIDHALLSNVNSEIIGLKHFNQKNELREYLERELDFGKHYFEMKTKKEWANWFSYLHLGLRWCKATTADLSYFTQPIFLLSDIVALTYGISSSAWSNFKNDRVRAMNRILLPYLDVAYSGGQITYNNTITNSINKVKYEYFNRLMVYMRGRKAFREKSREAKLFSEVEINEPG
ncbi:MAG: hypothetical protein ACNA8H_16315, partial [Anaerolineales bacterium]